MTEPPDPFEVGWPALRGGDPDVAARATADEPGDTRDWHDRPGWGTPAGPPPAGTTPSAPAEYQVAGAVVAGLLAAILAAVFWGYVVKLTGRELEFLGWGIGAAVGLTIARLAGRGVTGQTIGVVCTLVGYLIGKYFVFAFTTQDELRFAGTGHSVVSGYMLRLFRSDLGGAFGRLDILWAALAVITAWVLLLERDEPGRATADGAAGRLRSRPAALSVGRPPNRRSCRRPSSHTRTTLSTGWRDACRSRGARSSTGS